MTAKVKWLTTGEYAQKYGISYWAAGNLARTGKIQSKKRGKSVLLEDSPAPPTNIEELKAQKLEAEIARLRDSQDKERQRIADEAVKSYRGELVGELAQRLKQLKKAIDKCLADDPVKSQRVQSEIDSFLQTLQQS